MKSNPSQLLNNNKLGQRSASIKTKNTIKKKINTRPVNDEKPTGTDGTNAEQGKRLARMGSPSKVTKIFKGFYYGQSQGNAEPFTDGNQKAAKGAVKRTGLKVKPRTRPSTDAAASPRSYMK